MKADLRADNYNIEKYVVLLKEGLILRDGVEHHTPAHTGRRRGRYLSVKGGRWDNGR